MSLTLLIFLFWFFGLLSALRVLEGKGYATMSRGGEGVEEEEEEENLSFLEIVKK